MQVQQTKPLPPSRITNPFFAAFITSCVRAVLGEIMNALKAPTIVFSCTTDGFITNATPEEIEAAQVGPLSKVFAQARLELTGDPRVLEIKHKITRPLGWRTRGQATLGRGTAEPATADQNYVLAKGGIFIPKYLEDTDEKNEHILNLFFDRQPDTELQFEGVLTGIRDIVENDADLVEKLVSKRLNMEYDWKRRPRGVLQSEKYNHVAFSTDPWQSVEQFRKVRDAWEDYTRKEKACIKSIDDFDAFATYIEAVAALPKEVRSYLRKVDPDTNRLRQMLCAAWREAKAGFTPMDTAMKAANFAAKLEAIGLPCKRSDVENAAKKLFVPHNCPATAKVKDLLAKVKAIFPKLETELFLYVPTSAHEVSIRPTTPDCEHVAKVDRGAPDKFVELPKAA